MWGKLSQTTARTHWPQAAFSLVLCPRSRAMTPRPQQLNLILVIVTRNPLPDSEMLLGPLLPTISSEQKVREGQSGVPTSL